jgi:hypothetical protein
LRRGGGGRHCSRSRRTAAAGSNPAVAEERSELAGRAPDDFDRIAARLRTLRHTILALRYAVAGEGPWRRVGFECGALPAELDGAAEIGTVPDQLRRSGPLWWTAEPGWLASDRLGARWQLTTVPALPEIQFARALAAIADFVDGTVYYHPEVVLEHMLSPAVPLRDPAWDAVAAALLAKSPDLQRLATDVLVATVEDERFDAAKLGAGLARLLDAKVGAPARLAPSFRDAGRVSALHAAQLVRATGALVAALETAPRGLHAPLEAAAELSAGCGYRLAGAEGDALERIAATVSPSAKLARVARSLRA